MTQVHHVPTRTCVGCRATAPQPDLVRVVLAGGRVKADPGRRAAGRGAWVHPRRECLAAAAKGGFARSFRTSVGRADVEEILKSTTSGQGVGNAVESVPGPGAMGPGATD